MAKFAGRNKHLVYFDSLFYRNVFTQIFLGGDDYDDEHEQEEEEEEDDKACREDKLLPQHSFRLGTNQQWRHANLTPPPPW